MKLLNEYLFFKSLTIIFGYFNRTDIELKNIHGRLTLS